MREYMNELILESTKTVMGLDTGGNVMRDELYGRGETKDDQRHEISELLKLDQLLLRDVDESEVSLAE